MSRATLSQLVQLGLDSFAIDRIPDAQRQLALDSASARISAALATQFDVASIIPPYPLDIIECECVLASWTLLMSAGYNPATKGNDDNVALRYKQWQSYLDQVSRGELVPQVILSGTGEVPGVSGASIYTATSRGFSERGMVPNSFPSLQTGPFSDD